MTTNKTSTMFATLALALAGFVFAVDSAPPPQGVASAKTAPCLNLMFGWLQTQGA